MLQVTYILRPFADNTDSPLSSVALSSRFYSHSIQTLAIRAASYLARSVLRYHMQYVIKTAEIPIFQ